MALTNYERVKRWREKHRALYNLQRRNARKNLGADTELTESREAKADKGEVELSRPPPSSIPFETKKVGEFRMLVLPPKEVEEESENPVVKPSIFRDDSGRVITERAWNALQKLKEKAKQNEYEIDDYIQ